MVTVGFCQQRKKRKEKKREKRKKERKKERKKREQERITKKGNKKERVLSPPVAGAKPKKHPKTFERLISRCLCLSRSQ